MFIAKENRLSRNWKYWVWSLFGFVALYLITLAIPKLNFTEASDHVERIRTQNIYFLWESITCGILAFLLSFIMLIYFEKNWDWEKVNTKQIIRLILVFILVQILYSLILWPILSEIVFLLYQNYDLVTELSLVKKLTNAPYFGLRFSGWFWIVFVYYGYGCL